ncbi:uncharacterized protein LOC129575931 [Sitodiplosis mosellana]|uniref:uncharacterized protein LOC129575931 n=1 Tax=Sitodiplosis mosellana TaxID=263140 RepID=UPI0024448326|nr:uncharacterized protein LOC129575931 [Sitodiplosis mosellana]
MDPETRAVLEAVQSFKKKAPKLKTGDRTLSLAVDNYAPGTLQQQQSSQVASGVTIDPNLLIDNNLIIPPPSLSHIVLSSPIQEFRKPNIFYMDGSNHSLNNYSDFTHPHTTQMSRKPNIRRSDTLDVYGAYEMRKANSFNSNDMTSDEILMSRRTNSMRHTQAAAGYPYEMDDIGSLPPPAPPIVTETGNNRRNCRMHKSFHDRSRHHEIKKEKIVDAVKCHSLGDDGSDDNVITVAGGSGGGGGSGSTKRRLSPKFNSAESSLDNEVFHSRSGSRNKMESTSIEAMDAIESATSPTTMSSVAMTKKLITSASHKHSSQSLDKPHHSFRRIARATQSFYLNPVQAEELRLQRAMHGSHGSASGWATAKRMHSASMRTKSFRDVVSEAKKSKSFISDPYGGVADYELSPRRRESISEVKKSPRLSSSTYDQKTSNYDGNDLDYDVVMHAYRQNRRKSSILSASGGGGGSKKKSSSKKKSMDGNEVEIDEADTEDGETESTRKRKRIVCIFVSLFLSLVFAGVFVVVFTLTYSSMTQVPDKRVYFAPGPGNRDMPIHHHGNVRQENERIQESINRGKYVRNITHAAFIGGQQYQQQSQHP